MAARNRMPPWHENVRLSNGREILIRPIRPEDALTLRAGFALLQPDEVRQRFLHPMKELSVEQAERLARPNTRREFALVAAEPLPPGEALVGAVARIVVDDDGKYLGVISRTTMLKFLDRDTPPVPPPQKEIPPVKLNPHFQPGAQGTASAPTTAPTATP